MKNVIVKRILDTMKPDYMHYAVYEETENGSKFIDLFSFDPSESPETPRGENQAKQKAMDLAKFVESGKPNIEETIVYKTGQENE